MFGIILGVLFVVAGFVGAKVAPNVLKKIGPLAGIIACGICVLCASLTSVPTGYTGVVTTFGRVEDKSLDSGMHVVLPWQSVTKMDNRVQLKEYELLCFSSDIQEVSINYKVNFQIDKANAQMIYKNLGTEYSTTILMPRVQEAVKSVIAKYTAETLIINRDHLSEEIEDILVGDVAQYNITVVTTALADMDFSDAFTNAVEAKQVAEQNKLKAQTEQAQMTMEASQQAERAQIEATAAAEVAKTKANADAEVAKIAANADLEVQKINADAAEYTGQKEAAKNKVLSENLNEALLQYYYIQQWNGVLPTVEAGENSGLLLDIGSLRK